MADRIFQEATLAIYGSSFDQACSQPITVVCGLIFSSLCLALVTPRLLSEGAELLITTPRVIRLVLPFVLYVIP